MCDACVTHVRGVSAADAGKIAVASSGGLSRTQDDDDDDGVSVTELS